MATAAEQLSLSAATRIPDHVKREYDQLVESLERSYERHAHILRHGTSDPFWHDGMNLNLVRNRIIYLRRELINLCNAHFMAVPAVARRALPKEYPFDHCIKCRPTHS